MNRNELLRRGGVGVTLVSMGGLAAAVKATAAGDDGAFRDEGVGTYTDPSVANQISNFSINRQLVSCGVGTIAAVGSGPFAMLMYSTNITSYKADHLTRRITAEGRMRSITRIAGATIEDVQHDFLAIAVDTGATRRDRFDVHFTTPFWSPGNPFCTPSDVHPGWCRFGGVLIADERGEQMGDVAVG
jgi:hypothetical protein